MQTSAPEKAPLWTKNFILISALNFSLIFIFYLLVIVIVGYAISDLHASTAQAGLISGLFIIGTLIGRVIVGKILARCGSRWTLLVGFAGFFIFSLLYFLPLDVNGLLAARFVHGFMMGLASTVLGSTIAQIIPTDRRGEGIGYYSMSNTLGTAIGPFLAIWMMLHYGYQSIFIMTTVISFLAFLCSFAVKFPQLQQLQKKNSVYKRKLEQYIEPKALPIALLIMLLSLSYAGVLAFINPYAKSLDLVQAATLYFLVYAITVLASRPITGPLVDRKGANAVVYPAFICMITGMVLLAYTQTAWALFGSAVLLGLGFGNLQSIFQSIAIKGIPLDRMGYATSTFFIFLEVGLGIGPYLLGLVLAFLNYSQMYLVCAGCVTLSFVMYYMIYGTSMRSKSS